jgi:hypothetical protein
MNRFLDHKVAYNSNTRNYRLRDIYCTNPESRFYIRSYTEGVCPAWMGQIPQYRNANPAAVIRDSSLVVVILICLFFQTRKHVQFYTKLFVDFLYFSKRATSVLPMILLYLRSCFSQLHVFLLDIAHSWV